MDTVTVTRREVTAFLQWTAKTHPGLTDCGPWFADGPSSLAIRGEEVVAFRSCGSGSYTPAELRIVD